MELMFIYKEDQWNKCHSIKLYLFYDIETSYSTYINHACWHRSLRLCGLCEGGNWRNQPVWLGDHMTISYGTSGTSCYRYEISSPNESINLIKAMTALHVKGIVTLWC